METSALFCRSAAGVLLATSFLRCNGEKSLQFLALFFLEAQIPKSTILLYCYKEATSDNPAMAEEEVVVSWILNFATEFYYLISVSSYKIIFLYFYISFALKLEEDAYGSEGWKLQSSHFQWPVYALGLTTDSLGLLPLFKSFI